MLKHDINLQVHYIPYIYKNIIKKNLSSEKKCYPRQKISTLTQYPYRFTTHWIRKNSKNYKNINLLTQ